MSKELEKILKGADIRETIKESHDLLEMANVLGKRVKTDFIEFSFYFSDKYGMQHGIRSKVKWDRDKFTKPEDGYFELHGDYAYVNSSDHFISKKDVEKAREFFKKYKVLFAAVWEGALDQSELQAYFRGDESFEELLKEFYLDADDLSGVTDLKSLEMRVREKKLFNMND